MPSENTVFKHFGILGSFLSSFLRGGVFRGCISWALVLLAAGCLAKPVTGSAAPAPYVVVLDPGHGGGDVGASVRAGKSRVTEKEIALGIAIRVQKVLEDEDYWKPLGRKVKVILTRDRDQTVSLDTRSARARKAGADLFLSIHANSDPSRKASGLETYFLNNTESSSLSKLEQIENKRGGSRSAASLVIRSVAADAVVAVSREAADTLHNSLLAHLRSSDLKVNDRGVRQGMFYVLLDSQVPAVLLEAFFLSDAHDREFVSQPENRQKIAEGIAKGVLRFLATR